MKENVLHKVLMGKLPPPPPQKKKKKKKKLLYSSKIHLIWKAQASLRQVQNGTDATQRICKPSFSLQKKIIGISFLFNKLIHERLNPPEKLCEYIICGTLSRGKEYENRI